MKFDWKNYSLEDVCERIYSGGTPSTKHSDYWNGELKWLSSGETSQRFIYDTERKITQRGVENSSTKLATKGCTVIATAGQGYTRGQASFLMTDTYMNQSVSYVKSKLDSKSLHVYIIGNGNTVIEQYPSATSKVSKGDKVFIKTNGTEITLPDMNGWSKKEVQAYASLSGIKLVIEGTSGHVTSQSVASGSIVHSGDEVTITLS